MALKDQRIIKVEIHATIGTKAYAHACATHNTLKQKRAKGMQTKKTNDLQLGIKKCLL